MVFHKSVSQAQNCNRCVKSSCENTTYVKEEIAYLTAKMLPSYQLQYHLSKSSSSPVSLKDALVLNS